ncbi:MAG: type II toxin-antitoxin system VapC family toxin [Candidatus Eisenbacteria bacterium]|uniref:Ribonuclease VapC n=1 Tax=Eiseniibacteriota bacterium TaxID=2212470 RepID=A0A538UDP0_UNCEI|nr:MAG: type II toxin-antitoxin system VapC family toxin [Candidatus Eisenbacteria bacterium]
MILVDTSVWVDHLRFGNAALVSLLESEQVLTHPFVIGELACGQLRNRREVLRLLGTLPSAAVASHEEVLAFLEGRRLFGRGVGWVDAHLLASAVVSHARLLALDRRLSQLARELRVTA